MAIEPTSKPPAPPPPSAPPPPPAPPPPSEQERANAAVASAKSDFGPMRRLRYGAAFVTGTLSETLSGARRWGRQGLWAGVGIGILAGIATGSLGVLLFCVVAATITGVALGAAQGILLGGHRETSRIHRTERYADDLLVRRQMQDAASISPSRGSRRRAASEAADARQNREDRLQQIIAEREAENTRDYNTYWQERVSADRQQQTPSSGVGF
jgi:hypothetical protein